MFYKWGISVHTWYEIDKEKISLLPGNALFIKCFVYSVIVNCIQSVS